MRPLVAAILSIALIGTAAAPRAGAGENVVMVELFTSQGCSSCPPADLNLAQLAGRDDVLALSLHVDYWDYLGWRDTFGSPAHTERQVAYRDMLGGRVVYTPQMVVHGSFDVPGYKPAQIEAAIARAAALPRHATIAIAERDGMLTAEIVPMAEPEPCTIWIASYDRWATVAIERGENAGRSISYSNVVDKLMRVGPWTGSLPRQISLPQPGAGEGVAVWLQDDASGRILAASFLVR